MSLRFLLGLLPSGLPEESNITTHEENVFRYGKRQFYSLGEEDMNVIIISQTPAKFHIGMLTISLLVGIAYGGYTAYTCWTEKNIFLGYIRNLVIALVCRTFFSIVFDGAILLGSPGNVGGGNFLLSIEQICLNLVIAFWLTLNIYLHERVQRNFNNEPTLLIYQFGVPGVALFFAFVWIFTLQDQWPNVVWWIFLHPFTQWIVNSINLLYLLIQLALLANIVRAMMKITLDNDAVSLLRKVSAMMGLLVLIFWLQFGLNIGRIPLRTTESYLYFFYLIDGLECVLICSILYFFNKWVPLLLNSLIWRNEQPTSEPNEILVSGGRGIVTIDSVFMTPESGRWKNPEEDGSKDVVYSNIVEPERLKKTLDLYKRLNIIPTNQVTTVEGEEFYDCRLQNSLLPEKSVNSNFATRFGSISSNVSRSKVTVEDKNFKTPKVSESKQKRNAFYSSKYLILDTKESEIPKYLETRPSVSSISGRDSLKDEKINQDCFYESNTSVTDELVRKWLDDNSEIMEKKNKTVHRRMNEERKSEIPETLKSAENLSGDSIPQNTIFSAINSVVSSVFFGSKADDKKSLDKEMEINFEEFCKQNVSKPINPPKIILDETENNINPTVTSSEKTGIDIGSHTNKPETKAEATEKLLNVNEKDLKSQSVESPATENKPGDTRIDDIIPSYNLENLKNELLKPSELLQKENEDEIYDVLKSKSQTRDIINEKPSDSKMHSFPDDKKIPEENKTLGESAVEFKNTSKLPVLDISESVEVLKNNLSLSHTENNLQIKPTSKDEEKTKSENPQNKLITYSDLLEFRSQRNESTTDQPNGISKTLFDFSEVLSSTIGSLISASSNFFTTRKHISDSETESVVTELENKVTPEAKTLQIEKPQEELTDNQQKTVLSTTDSDSEFSIEKKRDSSSSAGSFSVDQYYSQLMKCNQNFYTQSNSIYEKQKKQKTF